MALIFDSDSYHKKSRRHGTSGRRATTSYDKYGYQVANFGSSSFSTGTESVMHVLRVRPGVVVNVIDAPSSSSRSRTSSSHRAAEHKSSRKNSHSHRSDSERDSSWVMTHSPHPRALELHDERGTSNNSFGSMEATSPSRDLEPITRRSPPSRQHTPETHYATEPRDSPRHTTVPIDVQINSHSHSSHHSDYSLLSPSISSSDSALFKYDNDVDPHYSTHRHMPTPIEMPMQISPSERNFSRPFDFPSPAKPPSPTGSLPSTRTVRFNEDPVLPSPALVPRRKGWWNKRGDQLWDNEGGYAPAPEHDKYPLDLHDYPEPGTGWVNEDGVQIDMKRRIVRKKPLRSALKKTSL